MHSLARLPRTVAFLAVTVLATSALAQGYPAKPVRIIEPHPAGSIVDISVRGMAEALTQGLGQPFVVENRAGAEGLIGAEACARAAPDGYTLCGTDSLVVSLNPLIRSKLPYNPSRDFVPIVQFGFVSSIVVVNPSVPANTMTELLELAKAKPGSISWGSWGAASLSNIYIEWLKRAKGISFLNVPYKGAVNAAKAAVAGEVQVAVFGTGVAQPLLKAGKLKALAATGGQRSLLMPSLPSFKELGIEAIFRPWFGLLAPMGTPNEIIQRVNSVAVKALAQPAFRDRFLTGGGLEFVPPAGGTPEQFAAFLKTERETCEALVRITGIKEE
jgi:tripartite-type tricarboxylate transporter receptor subunit TctC